MEIAELEKSYQEQRKRLLNEIHSERLRQERENDATLMEKQRGLEQKFEKLVLDLQEKINKKEQDFQVIYCCLPKKSFCSRKNLIHYSYGQSNCHTCLTNCLCM